MSSLILENLQSFSHYCTPSDSNIKFVYNQKTGYVPLLKLLSIRARSEDYLLINNRNTIYERHVLPYLNFYKVYSSVGYFRNMSYGSRRTDVNVIILSMLSILGLNNKKNHALKDITRYNNKTVGIITNPVDVFALAVVKKEDINSIVFDNYSVAIDTSKIKILVSKEKFASPSYMNKTNNKRVRSYLVKELKLISTEYNIEVIKVSDEELKSYYTHPYTLKTNSLMEVIQADNRIKESVKLKLNNNLVLI